MPPKTEETSPAKSNGVKAEPVKDELPPPAPVPEPAQAGFRDIPLFSTSQGEWLHHVMKFASHSVVEPANPEHFTVPVKLNRKFPPRPKIPQPKPGDVVLGDRFKKIMNKDGTPLVWPNIDNEQEMENARNALKVEEVVKGPGMNTALVAPSASRAAKPRSNPFQKRVREVHHASDVTRQTRQEEYFPWILEDFETAESWESARKLDPRSKEALRVWMEYVDKHGRAPPRDVSKDQNVTTSSGSNGVTELGRAEGKGYAPWVGKMEGEQNKSSHHVLFILDHAGSGAFKVVPVRKTYRFLQRPKHSTLTSEQAEEVYLKQQKTRESVLVTRARDRALGGPSGTTAPPASAPRAARPKSGKKEENDGDEDRKWAATLGISLPGSGTVSFGSSRNALPGQDYKDFGGSSSQRRPNFKRAKREIMPDGADELDFQEDFADDDERMEMLDRDPYEDEETRELEQRLRGEMRKAENEEDGDEDEETRTLTGTGKQMKKIMKALGKREGNEAYESDEENPYASDDSEEEDLAVANPEKALEEAREERLKREREAGKEASNKPSPRADSRGGTPAPPSSSNESPSRVSRAGTPPSVARSGTPPANRQASLPPGSGHAAAAHRATSPQRNVSNKSRSRAGSPGASSLGPGAAAPAPSAGNKRRADGTAVGDTSTDSATNNSAKRARTSSGRPASPQSPSGSAPGSRSASPSAKLPQNDIEATLIELLRTGTNITTHDVVIRFKTQVAKDEEGKKKLASALKRVAVGAPDPRDPTKKILVLREGY